MRLVTVRSAGGTQAGRVEGDTVHLLPWPHVTELLRDPDWRSAALVTGSTVALADIEFDAVVRPAKVVCVGLNFRSHIAEMGRPEPEHPTLFAKFPDTLTGPYDPIAIADGGAVDWEAELGVVVGGTLRHAADTQARHAIAGFVVANDISMRDWQWRTTQWMQGKNFEATTPVGPVLVTADEVDDARDLEIRCLVDGEVVQHAHTSDLLFPPASVLAYVSAFTTLRPGDLVLTGTPGGVGSGRTPPRYLRAGHVVETTIDGIGTCRNVVVAAADKPRLVLEQSA